MLKKLTGTAGRLKSGVVRKIEYLRDVLECLLLITIIDEFCYVKLTNKRDLMKSIILRRRR
jgi:hypothetical protein